MEKSIDIQSNIRNICEIEYFLKRIFNTLHFSRKKYCKMYLSVNEAVTNAIIHGNHSDNSKNVHVDFIENELQYIIKITDEGKGFDYKNLKDPTSEKNLYKESGRGVFIMNQYADLVIYNEKGNTVTLIFNK